MALVKPFIFQVVGYQNRGKTTFITNIIEKLRAVNLETAVLKHHGHGGKPDHTSIKDSTKHFQAGAAASLVEGDGTIELLGNFRNGTSIAELIQFLALFHPDVILIEGYKQEDFPKVILIKEENDLLLLKQLNNIKAIIAWPDCLEQSMSNASVPVFPLNSDHFISWFLEQI
ncbi:MULTISPECIES: molybdopterin-guanine dinucleotide biosynthesis protein B [unclassified Peribacillus]|uniref:molybdopterin-guanine dinucleotide biosynthesis protein B n=1 Tax=unclassified Peribacillus TaxID=2675266 RepID=UPI00191445DD|nr:MULTISPECIES: molybdopterin-guanine dinucleotide biosynthesis protein B [unclassified Peribacillus]MBK5444778.1 molybdopterin-guanine dinucleotide biosynthesis protein B [Peribacillus sp. TH24]MBK5460518.1 molybdopterin-guanine dinucleotide biosynthesis protein B [Peribacillus sp. TH27]